MVFKSLTLEGRGAGGKEYLKSANLRPLLVGANIFVSGVRKGFSSPLDLWMCLRGQQSFEGNKPMEDLCFAPSVWT